MAVHDDLVVGMLEQVGKLGRELREWHKFGVGDVGHLVLLHFAHVEQHERLLGLQHPLHVLDGHFPIRIQARHGTLPLVGRVVD